MYGKLEPKGRELQWSQWKQLGDGPKGGQTLRDTEQKRSTEKGFAPRIPTDDHSYKNKKKKHVGHERSIEIPIKR